LTLALSSGVTQDLPLDDDNVRHYGVAVDDDTGDIFLASSVAVEKIYQNPLSNTWEKTTLIGGWVTFRVVGYNLGTELEDILHLSIRGVNCTTLYHESSNSLSCVSGHPELIRNGGGEIAIADFAVQTKLGGWSEGGYPGHFVETEIADHSLKPIITSFEVSSRPLGPHAIVLDPNGVLYFSNVVEQSIDRVAIDGSNMEVFMPNVGLVYGMALDRESLILYYTEAGEGTISRVALPGASTSALVNKSLIVGLDDPLGIALDPDGIGMFFTLYRGVIAWARRDGSDTGDNPQETPRDYLIIRRLNSAVRLDGIAVSVAQDTSDPTETRLYWTESGPWHAIRHSTIHGTGVEALAKSGIDHGDIMWPRGLAFNPLGAGVIFTEYLGTVRQVSTTGGDLETLWEADTYAAAALLKVQMRRTERRGIDGQFFTEALH
ncbi:unnamed protein product, partial [Discosporangium mesarthrocarpum]